MITIDRTTPYRPIRKPETNPVESIHSVTDQEVNKANPVLSIDRRKSRDRRRENKGNGMLETRSGGDRRKNKNRRLPSIDIEA